MRIAYVCHYFVPEPAAPAARVHEFARAWVRAGHAVSVITTFPNHPLGRIPAAYRGRWWATEWLDGIRVLRCWLYAVPNQGVGRRGLDHLSFMLTAVVFGLPRLGRVEVVIAPSAPKRVYAFIESEHSALYRSDDGGKSWIGLDRSQSMVWRPFYFARLVIDPTNPDRLFKTNLNLIASEDGGRSFSDSGGGDGSNEARADGGTDAEPDAQIPHEGDVLLF